MYETFALIKPDAFLGGLVGAVITTFEEKGFYIIRAEMLEPCTLTLRKIKLLYRKFENEPFCDDLLGFMLSAPVMPMILGLPDHNPITVARALVGSYENPLPGTIRGKWAESLRRNVVHTSDSHDAYVLEAEIFFPGHPISSLWPATV